MKKILFTIFAAFAMMTANAQTIVQKRAYSYNTYIPLNSNYEPIDRLSVTGVIVFSVAAGTDFVSVTVGDDVPFNGPVKSEKKSQNGNEIIHTYLFITEFQGRSVPMQLFEIYDISVSRIVPARFMISIHSTSTGEYVQGHSFEGISRVK